MKTLVIVVTYNGMQWMERCLGCVRSSVEPADLFVFDNASSDGTAAYVKENFPEAILVENDSNLGFAAGNNAGFRYAMEHGYDFVYLLNQDAWFFPDTLGRLQAISEANPGFGILSPCHMRSDGISYNPGFERDVLSRRKGEATSNLFEVPFIMAAHWFVTADCLRKVGIFADIFPIYGNDNNYCHRALFHGYKIGVVDDMKVVHDKQYRPLGKDYWMYRSFYISCLVQLCDIRHSLFSRVLFVLALSLVKCVKFRSFKVFAYLGKVFCKDMPQVLRIRKETVKPAFQL